MVTISVRKHLAENLWHLFAMLHRLQGVPESSNIPKQRGDQPKKTSANLTTLVNLNVKREFEPKGK